MVESLSVNIDDIVKAAQLASLLEVAGTPKPGNVHRTADFADTRFEHFLAGSIALGPALRIAASRGYDCGQELKSLKDLELGKLIKKAVCDIKHFHKGSNTHLGIILLVLPLSVSAGMIMGLGKKITPNRLHQNVSKVMTSTTVEDSLHFFDALKMLNFGRMGQVDDDVGPDALKGEAKQQVEEERFTLFELMEISSQWDMIAQELITGLNITFNVGYPAFIQEYQIDGNVNTATVHMFLRLLSKYPDTLIARKVGLLKTNKVDEAVKIGISFSEKISEEAKKILQEGGLRTHKGIQLLKKLDKKLRRHGNRYNPGTTADIVTASLMVAILCGFRP